ncbi:hypothetical protein Bbelb_012920 [Branchiostoma belcheri]|nr:hypothetical protein Bbelb_012920 [Branchiostoma belcheri]
MTELVTSREPFARLPKLPLRGSWLALELAKLPRARLPRSGNLHQRAKGFCGPDSEFGIQGIKDDNSGSGLSCGVGWHSSRAFDYKNSEYRARSRVVPGTCLDMHPDVLLLGNALNTTFLTPPRCEWVPNFGWGKSY